MQLDMHFHATHAIALLAGLSEEDALTVATAAEFVDNADSSNPEKNENKELFFAIATAHHPAKAVVTSAFHPEIHRLVWVPFHFLPGGEGSTLEEKLLCVKNGKIVNQMFQHYLEKSGKDFYWHLLGIASHVYLDTFSHYGFSGIASELNEIANGSIKFKVQDQGIHDYLWSKFEKFSVNYGNEVLELASKGLGHGAVATFPDRPYLTWEFEYENPRGKNGNVKSGKRNNPETFLEGLEKLHHYLVKASKNSGNGKPTDFSKVKDEIDGILRVEADKEGRCSLWQDFIQKHFGINSEYPGEEWGEEKDEFENKVSPEAIGNCYRFHQAAAIHRWYVLKDLLPEHGIYCA